TARAELVSYFSYKCNRINHLGFDPEFELQFAEHYLWFVLNAAGASALQYSPNIPDLSLPIKKLLLDSWTQHLSKPGQTGQNAKRAIKNLKETKKDKENRIAAIRRRNNSRMIPGALDKIARCEDANICAESSFPNTVSLGEWASDAFMGQG